MLLLLVLLTLVHGQLQELNTTTCDSCGSQCTATTVELSTSERCRCDADCTAYGDCCSDRPQCRATTSPLEGLECRRTENVFLDTYVPFSVGVREAYWMVSACPEAWLVDEDVQRMEINANCTNNAPLPPVSDSKIGIVYKNEYCAVCNGADSVVQWQYGLGCTIWLSVELFLADHGFVVFELDLNVIARECLVCSYEPPQQFNLASQARACYPHTSSCLSPDDVTIENYEQVVARCASEPFNPVWADPGGTVYRNQYCAMCNNVSKTTCASLPGAVFPGFLVPLHEPSFCAVEAERLLGDQVRPPSVPVNNTVRPPSVSVNNTVLSDQPLVRGVPFNVVLDVRNSGVQVSTTIIDTVSVKVACGENQLYDPALQECRSTVCPEVFNSSAGGCTFPTVGNTSCETGLIELTENDDFKQLNNSTLIYSDVMYDIVHYLEGNPVICANLSINGTATRSTTRNVTETFYNYPDAYFVLTYVGCSLSLVGATIILLSLALFKELRTLTTMILANLSGSIVVANLFILIGGPVAEATQSRPLCVSVGIVLHFFFLAQFSWMTIMSVEVARTLVRGIRLRAPPSSRANRCNCLVYFLLGWGAPLAIVATALAVNYSPSTSHLVLYGRLEDGTDGLCWINHTNSAILAFVVPVALCLSVNIVLLILITIILMRAIRNQISISRSSPYVYVRVYGAVFFSSGATWVFGFLALAASKDWAWYPFIIFNSVQGFLLLVAFLLTKKVGALYLFLFSCGKLDYRTTTVHTSSKATKTSSSAAMSPSPKLLRCKVKDGIELQDPKTTGAGKRE